MRYILAAKPNDHKILMECVKEQRQFKGVSRMQVKDLGGRLHIYECINEMPLNGSNETVYSF